MPPGVVVNHRREARPDAPEEADKAALHSVRAGLYEAQQAEVLSLRSRLAASQQEAVAASGMVVDYVKRYEEVQKRVVVLQEALDAAHTENEHLKEQVKVHKRAAKVNAITNLQHRPNPTAYNKKPKAALAPKPAKKGGAPTAKGKQARKQAGGKPVAAERASPSAEGEPTGGDAAAGSPSSDAGEAYSFEASPPGPAHRTVVLIGVTGGGKSTVGNALLGRDAFHAADSLGSVTAGAQHADCRRVAADGALREYRVVDTAGLNDTGRPSADVMAEFGTFCEHVPLGTDIFLFVTRYGRCRPEFEAAVDAFVSSCGEAALGHTLLVLTHCPLSGEALAAQIDEQAPDCLRRLLPRLAGPPLGVDVLADRRGARDALQEAIDDACARRGDAAATRYSNETIEEARDQLEAGQDEEERAAFAAAVADWRKAASVPVR